MSAVFIRSTSQWLECFAGRFSGEVRANLLQAAKELDIAEKNSRRLNWLLDHPERAKRLLEWGTFSLTSIDEEMPEVKP